MEDFKKERVAVYIRVATKAQSSLEDRVEIMKKYVAEHPGWELHSVYCDVCPAARFSQRMGLAKLIRGARQGEYTTVVIPKASMLSGNIFAHHKLLIKLEQAGATVDYADGTSIGEIKLLANIMKAMGE